MASGKPGGIAVGAAVAIVAFVVLYFGAPGPLASFCAERASGWTPSTMVWQVLVR